MSSGETAALSKQNKSSLFASRIFIALLTTLVLAIILFLAIFEPFQEKRIHDNAHSIDNTVSNCTDCPPGQVGDQGLDGPEGPEGEQGDVGPQGPTGPTGDQGDQGPLGPQGDQGINGTQGIQGVGGTTGPIGPDGSQGTQGVQGVSASIDNCTKSVGSMCIANGTNVTDIVSYNLVISSIDQWTPLTASVCDLVLADAITFLGNCNWETQAILDTYKIELDVSFETVGIFDPEVWIGITFDGLEPELKNAFSTHGRPDESLSFRINKVLPPNTTIGLSFLNAGNTDDISIKRLQLTIVGEFLCGFNANGTQGAAGPQGIDGSPGDQGNQGDQGINGTDGTQGVQGIQGTQGIQGAQGPNGTTVGSLIFFIDDTFVVPPGVTTLFATCQAGGGGGGSGGTSGFQEFTVLEIIPPGDVPEPHQVFELFYGGGGGGGGSGRILTTLVTVVPGETLNVAVGLGGVGGVSIFQPVNASRNGQDGASSILLRNNTILFDCTGGSGGLGGCNVNVGFDGDPVWITIGSGGDGGDGYNGGGGGGAGDDLTILGPAPTISRIAGIGGAGIDEDGANGLFFLGLFSYGGRGGGNNLFSTTGGPRGECDGVCSGSGGGGGAPSDDNVMEASPVTSIQLGGSGADGGTNNVGSNFAGGISNSLGGGGGGGAGSSLSNQTLGADGGNGGNGYFVVTFL